jgi:cobalt/nickel transport system ATP-binding protein
MLEFDQVCYTYPGSQKPALTDLSLSIPEGSRCAMIGQNGCGKTTLFLLANGLYKPQSGTIRWQGQPLGYDRAALIRLRQQIGLVFQDPEHQIVASTVEEDLSYGLVNQGLQDGEIADRVHQALLDFDLLNLVDTPVHHLSLGQKKRLSIADVMVLRPQLLLLDEPTAYLDPLHTRQLLATLGQIHASGTTILMATHDLDLVQRWADWVLVLNRGALVLAGRPNEVFSQQPVLEQLQLGLPPIAAVLAQMEQLLQAAGGPTADPDQIAWLKATIVQRLRLP